jgi:hypothetical protein
MNKIIIGAAVGEEAYVGKKSHAMAHVDPICGNDCEHCDIYADCRVEEREVWEKWPTR